MHIPKVRQCGGLAWSVSSKERALVGLSIALGVAGSAENWMGNLSMINPYDLEVAC